MKSYTYACVVVEVLVYVYVYVYKNGFRIKSHNVFMCFRRKKSIQKQLVKCKELILSALNRGMTESTELVCIRAKNILISLIGWALTLTHPL